MERRTGVGAGRFKRSTCAVAEQQCRAQRRAQIWFYLAVGGLVKPIE